MTKYIRIQILVILSSLIMILSFSCKTNHYEIYQLKNGLIYKYGEDKTFTGIVIGKVKDKYIEYEVINGKKNGKFILRFSNGTVEMVGKIKENRNEGTWNYYYVNGSLESTGNFKNDLPEGKWLWYYDDKKLMEEGIFYGGNKEGEWKNYNKSGQLVLQRNYKDNLLIDSINLIQN